VMQPGAPGATGKEPLKMPSEGKPPAPPAPGKKETSQIQTPGSLNLGN
jgi:hypothetical protein